MDGDKRPREVTLKEQSLAKRVMSGTQAAAVYVIEVIILAYFFLAFGEIFLRRLVRIPPSLRAKIQVVKMTQEIESEISNYLFTITCINARPSPPYRTLFPENAQSCTVGCDGGGVQFRPIWAVGSPSSC